MIFVSFTVANTHVFHTCCRGGDAKSGTKDHVDRDKNTHFKQPGNLRPYVHIIVGRLMEKFKRVPVDDLGWYLQGTRVFSHFRAFCHDPVFTQNTCGRYVVLE